MADYIFDTQAGDWTPHPRVPGAFVRPLITAAENPGLRVWRIRLLPGAISDHESASTDSFYDGLLSPPSYTRPAEYRGLRVPDVLLSGDHAKIAAWRREQSERLTRERRPELLGGHPGHG